MSRNRREFLKVSALAMGGVTAARLAGSNVLGANDRIRVGIIGVGGMGNSHLNRLLDPERNYNCEVVAVCDVYRRRVNRAAEKCQGTGYMDYRELLERDDIDAVFVVTPDHWHAKIAMEAMDAGKHVYLEKPMTLTIEQALEVREAVNRSGKVLQVGPGRTSDDKVWKAQQIIADGRVGKVTWAQGGYNRNIRGCGFNEWFPIDETAGPDKTGEDYVNWDQWLGYAWELAPQIPWNPEHFFRFRKYWPYNGGVATDLLYHILAPTLLAIRGVQGEYPRRVTANGGLYIYKDGRDIPDVFMMGVDYASEFSVHLISVLTNNSPVPMRIYGQYGTIDLSGEEVILTANGDYVEEFRGMNDGYEQVQLHGEERPDMQSNFFQVIREGGQLYCDAELGCATMVAIKLAVEAYRRNQTMLWDGESEQALS